MQSKVPEEQVATFQANGETIRVPYIKKRPDGSILLLDFDEKRRESWGQLFMGTRGETSLLLPSPPGELRLRPVTDPIYRANLANVLGQDNANGVHNTQTDDVKSRIANFLVNAKRESRSLGIPLFY